MTMEIEVKAKLRDRDEVVKKLASLGCKFSPVKTQDDMVWVEKMGSLKDFLSIAYSCGFAFKMERRLS